MLQSFTLYMYGQFVPPWLTVLTGLSPDFTASEMIGITIHGSSPMAKVHRANSNIPYTPTNQLGSYCINDLAMSMKTLSPTLVLVVAQKKYANVDLKNVYIKTLCPTLSLIFAHKTIQMWTWEMRLFVLKFHLQHKHWLLHKKLYKCGLEKRVPYKLSSIKLYSMKLWDSCIYISILELMAPIFLLFY